MRWRAKSLICFWLSCAIFMSNDWKNVSMIMACVIKTNKHGTEE